MQRLAKRICQSSLPVYLRSTLDQSLMTDMSDLPFIRMRCVSACISSIKIVHHPIAFKILSTPKMCPSIFLGKNICVVSADTATNIYYRADFTGCVSLYKTTQMGFIRFWQID
ncbi:hypothetical protein ALO68_102252 [Pseudomonas syringae pv. helianthi]|uniref:Uncharacterized protein n=1 Tax=Pseudomonas syringae pv. helianthi TaxID=251654 RepID=A0A0N8RLE0_9PSED|nr:hypothetical protein ALO68_102252 [Pseudomonas syringae pv. helianthi]RMV50571.1 hypothetical protein ALP10_101970 [Pseudomonas syringae pv. helianthi]